MLSDLLLFLWHIWDYGADCDGGQTTTDGSSVAVRQTSLLQSDRHLLLQSDWRITMRVAIGSRWRDSRTLFGRLKELVGASEALHNPLMMASPASGLWCWFPTAIPCRPIQHVKDDGKRHWGPLAGLPSLLALHSGTWGHLWCPPKHPCTVWPAPWGACHTVQECFKTSIFQWKLVLQTFSCGRLHPNTSVETADLRLGGSQSATVSGGRESDRYPNEPISPFLLCWVSQLFCIMLIIKGLHGNDFMHWNEFFCFYTLLFLYSTLLKLCNKFFSRTHFLSQSYPYSLYLEMLFWTSPLWYITSQLNVNTVPDPNPGFAIELWLLGVTDL